MLVNHTEEDDLYKYIFEDNRDIKKVIPRGCTKEFMEVLQHLLYHYEEDQEYEKCQKICDFIDQWEM